MDDREDLPDNVIPFPVERVRSARARLVDPHARLELEATARGMPGLVDLLEQLCGLTLDGRYRIQSLVRLGSQFAVFRGAELDGDPVAVKLPLVDYTRPASFGLRQVQAARQVARREWEVLGELQGMSEAFPRPCALVIAENPLLERRGRAHAWHEETFLAEEWIGSESLDDSRQALFAQGTPAPQEVEGLALKVARGILEALVPLAPRVFADVAPRNFLWCERTGGLRIVDASSLVPAGTALWERSGSSGAPGRIVTPVTLCYLHRAAVEAFRQGEPVIATEALMLLATGKMLYELCTNLHPVEGVDPASEAVEFARLSPAVQDLIGGLLDGTHVKVKEALDRLDALEQDSDDDGR